MMGCEGLWEHCQGVWGRDPPQVCVGGLWEQGGAGSSRCPSVCWGSCEGNVLVRGAAPRRMRRKHISG